MRLLLANISSKTNGWLELVVSFHFSWFTNTPPFMAIPSA